MDVSGQSLIKVRYESDEDSGLSSVTFEAPGEVSLGVITIETNKLKSFFASIATVFVERESASGLPTSSEAKARLMLRVNQQEAEIGYLS